MVDKEFLPLELALMAEIANCLDMLIIEALRCHCVWLRLL